MRRLRLRREGPWPRLAGLLGATVAACAVALALSAVLPASAARPRPSECIFPVCFPGSTTPTPSPTSSPTPDLLSPGPPAASPDSTPVPATPTPGVTPTPSPGPTDLPTGNPNPVFPSDLPGASPTATGGTSAAATDTSGGGHGGGTTIGGLAAWIIAILILIGAGSVFVALRVR